MHTGFALVLILLTQRALTHSLVQPKMGPFNPPPPRPILPPPPLTIDPQHAPSSDPSCTLSCLLHFSSCYHAAVPALGINDICE